MNWAYRGVSPPVEQTVQPNCLHLLNGKIIDSNGPIKTNTFGDFRLLYLLDVGMVPWEVPTLKVPGNTVEMVGESNKNKLETIRNSCNAPTTVMYKQKMRPSNETPLSASDDRACTTRVVSGLWSHNFVPISLQPLTIHIPPATSQGHSNYSFGFHYNIYIYIHVIQYGMIWYYDMIYDINIYLPTMI